jgi:uncharacterized protein YndB with AHSA1/START domain
MTAIDHKYEVALDAAPEAVFAALTETKALRVWFAEDTAGEMRPGGSVKIGGRGAYQSGVLAIETFDAPRALSFLWRLHGVDSQVDWSLTPEEGKTKFSVRHRFDKGPEIPRAKDMVDDLWRLHVTNLQAFLAKGAPEILLDFADHAPKVDISIWIDAPRAKVFKALMDPQWLHAWVNNEWVETHKTIVEPRVGGQYKYGWKYEVAGRQVDGGPTKILELVENERLVTDWTDWRGDPAVPPQRISWTLTDERGGTRLTMVHDRFVRVVDISDYGGGWQYFLGAIKRVAEKGPA